MSKGADRAAELNAYADSIRSAKDDFKAKYDAADSPSEDIKNFKILTILGHGGYGTVYRAEKDSKPYAIKQMTKAKYREKKKQRKAVIERKISYAFHNEFIVKLHYKYKDKENLYLMLEYTPLCDVGDMIPRTDFTELRAAKILAQVVLGVEYIHACDVIYCDLKPRNVLLFPGGRVKLTDFGMSQLSTMRNSVREGTAAYMAPEVLEHKLYSDAIDWWALGIMMFKMLLKAHPFGTFESPRNEMFNKIMNAQMRGLDESSISAAAKSLLRGLLNKDRTNRMGTLRDGSADLKSHPWFKDIDFNGLILSDRVFEVAGEDDREQRDKIADPDVFRNIGPDDDDPCQEEFNGF